MFDWDKLASQERLYPHKEAQTVVYAMRREPD